MLNVKDVNVTLNAYIKVIKKHVLLLLKLLRIVTRLKDYTFENDRQNFKSQ